MNTTAQTIECKAKWIRELAWLMERCATHAFPMDLEYVSLLASEIQDIASRCKKLLDEEEGYAIEKRARQIIEIECLAARAEKETGR